LALWDKMKYKIIFRPLTDISNRWAVKQDQHTKGAEESHEAVIDAENENHALHIFMRLVEHSGMKIASYRIESLYQNNGNNQ